MARFAPGLAFLLLCLWIGSTVCKSASFSCGRLFYRTLHLDEAEDALYVGAMDHVYRLDASSGEWSCKTASSLPLSATHASACESKGKSGDYECRNHVRVIQRFGRDKLYICGTNAHAPRDLVLYTNLTQLGRHEFFPGVGDGIAKCPFDPEDNATAIFVENGNPGGHVAIYSGTNADFNKADSVIFRGDIFDVQSGRREYSFKRTIKYDSHMLDKPDFVGSFDVGQYVYFFFRETAVEYLNCGHNVYSRVARVCKRDVGGKNILSQNWATFFKARLNCSLATKHPFYFNHIQDVVMTNAADQGTLFHAIFTTEGLMASAVCTFRLEDLERTFDEGKFKEQATSTSVWLPVHDSQVPKPRPGACVADTRKLSDTILNFVRKHPLMDTDVHHDNKDGPVFVKRDVAFHRIAVQRVVAGAYGLERSFLVYFLGTADGRIMKLSRWRDDITNVWHSHLLDVFDATSPEPVRAMTVAKNALFVSSDEMVLKMDLRSKCAERHTTCFSCVRDPYCGFDTQSKTCMAIDNENTRSFTLLQDPTGESKSSICRAALAQKEININFGATTHLPCPRGPAAAHKIVSWTFVDTVTRQPVKVQMDGQHYLLTNQGGLVLMYASEAMTGLYRCSINEDDLEGNTIVDDTHADVAEYFVRVDGYRCRAPNNTQEYQRAYSEWCSTFQKYKDALNFWENSRNERHRCIEGDNRDNGIEQRIQEKDKDIFRKSNAFVK